MPTNAWFATLRRAAAKWSDDDASQMAAALSYYGLFSAAPLIVISIALAGFIFGPEAARGQIQAEMARYLGADAAKTLEALVEAAYKPRESIWATILAIGLLIFGAVGVLAHLNAALEKIWARRRRAPGGLLGILRTYILGLGLVLGTGALVVVAVLSSLALGAVAKFLPVAQTEIGFLWRLIELGVSVAILSLAFAVTYRITSGLRWRHVYLGALVAALIFGLGKLLFGLYIEFAGVQSAFGAAGSLVVVLLWMYYSAQAFFFGAEIAAVAGNTAARAG